MEKVGDIDGQAARLIELLMNAPLHQRMVEAARNTALSRFCTDLVIPRYEHFYNRICYGQGTLHAAAVSI
jgi:hypothetical protein